MKWTNFYTQTFGKILSSIWRLWFFIVFVGVFLLFIPPMYFYTRIYKSQKKVCNLTRYWSLLTLWFSGVFIKINKEENLDPNKTYIICPNHVSSLDIPIILASFNIPVMFMAKQEYAKIPIFGWFYKHNTILVNRANKRDAYSAFTNSIEKLDKGINVCIFPEGGIPKSNLKLKTFKNGPFKLAQENKNMILPVTMPDNKKLFPWSYFSGRPGIANVCIHKAINTDSLEKLDVKKLNNQVYNIIFEELNKYEN